MLTRRDWLCSCARSAAALTLPALLGTAGAIWPLRAGARDDETLAVERFLYDPRFGAAHDVAQTVARTGVQTSAVADDLMALWYDDLDRRFRQGPMALAGVTLPEALFVLETLALDHQMRVVFRGEHAAAENGRIAHRLRGPAAIVDSLATLADDAPWEAPLGEAMTRCPLGSPDIAEIEFETAMRELPLRDMPLRSWIIAPREAVAITIES